MDIKQKEQSISEEAIFCQRNVNWWQNEINKKMAEFQGYEQRGFEGVNPRRVQYLINSLNYLFGKQKTEIITAINFNNKVYKLELEKELFLEHQRIKKKK